MDMLEDVDLAAAGSVRDDVMGVDSTSDQHTELDPLSAGGGGGARDTEAPPTSATPGGDIANKRKRRPRVGKRLQLALIRKYVELARQIQRLPDRLTTEQLLQEGHDEFYIGGGDANEPRLTYSAFMKLVRNRRCEFARLRTLRGAGSEVSGTANVDSDALGARAALDEEQQELRTLIEELDRVRRRVAPVRALTDYNPLDSTMSETSMSDAEQQRRHSSHGHAGHAEHLRMLSVDSEALETDRSRLDGELSAADVYAPASPAVATETADVVVIPRDKLDAMLRAAQETLRVQKKLLEDVRAIEHSLAGFR